MVVDPRNGRTRHLEADQEAELNRLISGIFKAECRHLATELRKFRAFGDVKYLRKQCLDCGAGIGPLWEQTAEASALSSWDHDLASDYESRLELERSSAIMEFLVRLDQAAVGQLAADAAHAVVLRWERMRQEVMKRASGLCECCADAAAVEVLHLTGKQVGDDDGSDLIALCRPCLARSIANSESYSLL